MNLSLYTIKRAELIWVNIWTYLFLKHIFIFIFIFKLWFDFINDPSPSKRTKLDRVLFTNSCFQFLSIFYKGHWFVWFCCTIIFLKNYFVIPPPPKYHVCFFLIDYTHPPVVKLMISRKGTRDQPLHKSKISCMLHILIRTF